MKLIYYTILIILCIENTSAQELTFFVKTDKIKLDLNEDLLLVFEINKEIDSFAPPKLNDFYIKRGLSENIEKMWVNGQIAYKKTFNYVLTPKKSGKITIGAGIVYIDEQFYRTKPVELEVLGKDEDPIETYFPEFLENVHLIVEVSNANSKLGDTITLVYKLYVSQDVGISNWEVVNSPKYAGFESENANLETIKVENGKFKDKDYRFVLFRKIILKSTQVGTFQIDPLELIITAELPTKTRDIFGSRLMKSITKKLESNPITINVKP